MNPQLQLSYAEMSELARAAAYSAIGCYRAGEHDRARECLVTEGELIAEMQRMAPKGLT